MKNFIKIIIVLVCTIVLYGCQNQFGVQPTNEGIVDDIILGKSQSQLDAEYSLELIMYIGEFYEDTELGAFYGDNWVGKCKLVISHNGMIESEYMLDDDWSEPMRFGNQFEIETYDYDNDGQSEFLIGQYLSSNINEYILYRMTKERIIEKIEGGENINISGKDRYSCTFDLIDLGIASYKYYDNSQGVEVKRIVRFEGDKVVIE